jgi:PKD repeat protein
MINLIRHRRGARQGVMALVLLLTASAASAETLLMPKRDYLMGASEVVWGITTLPNAGSTYTIDFGDGSSVGPAALTDRSFINANHTYASAGTFTVTLTVTPAVGSAEVATVPVQVFNGAVLSAENLRNLNKNRAIHNGFRYLWFSQANRTNFDTVHVTNWGGHVRSYTALTVLSLMNHGFTLPDNNSVPVGLLEKYLVRRGLNYVLSEIRQLTLTAQAAGDPCVNVSDAPAPCQGMQEALENQGYSTAVIILPFAASGALNRTVNAAEIPAAASCGGGQPAEGCVHGKTLGEVLQRLINALAFGQVEINTFAGRGGWIYAFNSNQSDGSTIGWDMLALLDASAAGTTIPAFVQPEFSQFALPQGLNTDGSFDYRADANPASPNNPNLAKAGIALQGLFFAGAASNDPRVAASTQYISDRWNSTALGQTFHCTNGTINKGCAYGMFNAFKGLKLYGVTTLPGVGRPAGPGAIPANDWHADLEDWLVTNQVSPTLAAGGGHWGAGNPMSFSCCGSATAPISTTMAELILAPVALIQPDPGLFSTVGLAPATATNAVGSSHTVTATATSSGGQPVPGATVVFKVNSGPHAGQQGQDVTDAQGQATFTYTGTAAGTDTLQAFIGTLGSNTVTKTWLRKCDADVDNDIDSADLLIIRNANGQVASSALDPRDGNSDGNINVADTRYCQLRCTRPSCAQ